jgi:hypothetical protein
MDDPDPELSRALGGSFVFFLLSEELLPIYRPDDSKYRKSSEKAGLHHRTSCGNLGRQKPIVHTREEITVLRGAAIRLCTVRDGEYLSRVALSP